MRSGSGYWFSCWKRLVTQKLSYTGYQLVFLTHRNSHDMIRIWSGIRILSHFSCSTGSRLQNVIANSYWCYWFQIFQGHREMPILHILSGFRDPDQAESSISWISPSHHSTEWFHWSGDVYAANSVGPRTDPWGTPCLSFLGAEHTVADPTLCVRSLR